MFVQVVCACLALACFGRLAAEASHSSTVDVAGNGSLLVSSQTAGQTLLNGHDLLALMAQQAAARAQLVDALQAQAAAVAELTARLVALEPELTEQAMVYIAADGSLTFVSPSGQTLVDGQDVLALLQAEAQAMGVLAASVQAQEVAIAGLTARVSLVADSAPGQPLAGHVYVAANGSLMLTAPEGGRVLLEGLDPMTLVDRHAATLAQLNATVAKQAMAVEALDERVSVTTTPSPTTSTVERQLRGIFVQDYGNDLNGEGVGFAASLALTAAGQPVVSHYSESDYFLHLVLCLDGPCIVRDLDDIGFDTSLALTTADRAVVAYYDSDHGRLKLAVCADPTCSNNTISIVDNTGGQYAKLVLTAQDTPVIAYYDFSIRSLKLAVCHDLECTSPVIRVVDDDGDVGYEVSLALTSTGFPVIAYSFWNGTHDGLKLAVCTDAACTTRTIRLIDPVGLTPSLALSSADIPVIAYASARALKLTWCADPACSGNLSVEMFDGIGGDPSLALTQQDKPIVAVIEGSFYRHFTQTSTDVLRLLVCANPSCTRHNLIDMERVGPALDRYITSQRFRADHRGRAYRSLSLALSPDGVPFMAYGARDCPRWIPITNDDDDYYGYDQAYDYDDDYYYNLHYDCRNHDLKLKLKTYE